MINYLARFSTRHMVPHFKVSSILDICFRKLKRAGFEAVILDKDNTLTLPRGSDYANQDIEKTVKECIELFGHARVAILSNSLGCGGGSVQNSLNISVIKHTKMKPWMDVEEILDHFRMNDPDLDLQPHQIVLVGDRYMTDVAIANFHGMLSVYVDGLSTEVTPLEKIAISIEKLYAKWCLARMESTPHKLLPNSNSFTITKFNSNNK